MQDVAISSDGQFALSGSWDSTLRLWDLNTGVTTRRFIGHSKDVLSVAFSADNRQIVSGSRDRSINLWSVSTHSSGSGWARDLTTEGIEPNHGQFAMLEVMWQHHHCDTHHRRGSA